MLEIPDQARNDSHTTFHGAFKPAIKVISELQITSGGKAHENEKTEHTERMWVF